LSSIEIQDVERLKVDPGDVLLVTISREMTPQDAQHVKNVFETTLPVRVIVKTPDIQVEVVEADTAVTR
jgi:hypothetical protein